MSEDCSRVKAYFVSSFKGSRWDRGRDIDGRVKSYLILLLVGKQAHRQREWFGRRSDNMYVCVWEQGRREVEERSVSWRVEGNKLRD